MAITKSFKLGFIRHIEYDSTNDIIYKQRMKDKNKKKMLLTKNSKLLNLI